MIFSQRMKEMRKKRGMTMLELAEQIGVGKSTIAGYEGNVRHPSQDKLKEIAIIFNTSTDYLLGLTDNPQPSKETNNLADILDSNNFHFNGKELSEEDLDLFISILERISKEKKEENNLNNNHEIECNGK